MQVIRYNYNSVPTVRAFINDRQHRHKCIIGPFGSGKSSGCVMALLNYAMQQEYHPSDPHRVRRTRFAIVRNSVKELKDTTKKTIDEWISPLKPKWKEAEDVYIIEFKLEDGSIVHSEWMLRSLDRPEQARDLLSLEVSGIWFNEAREIPKDIFVVSDGRVGRYPKEDRAVGFKCTYPVILLDSNPPDTDNWLYNYFEVLRAEDEKVAEIATIYKQPSGLSPQAENIDNLPAGYYEKLAIGKDPDFIKVYIHGEYGYVREGKPVFPNFVHSLHVVDKIQPIKSIPIIIGMDFGLFPACVFTQQLPDGRFHVFKEFITEDAIDIEEFVRSRILPLLRSRDFIGYTFIIIGDPAGTARSQLDSRTCFQTLRAMGLTAYPAYTNTLQPRIQAVNQYLTRMVKGKPAFQISSDCSVLIKALSGKYCFRRLRISGERYTEVPDKNIYSHVADALMYACLGYSPNQSLSSSYVDTDPNFSTTAPETRIPILKI